jgi:hypothetical protein
LEALPAMSATFSSAMPGGTALINRATPSAGCQVLLSDAGHPLIVTRPAGLGRVTWLAFDPTRPPFSGWSGHASLWRWLVSETYLRRSITDRATRSPVSNPTFAADDDWLANAPMQVAQMDPPSFTTIGLFVLAYLIVLVPVNYGILARINRKELAWVTVPAIVVAFSLAAYGLGYAMKGGRVLLSQASIVELGAGSRRGRELLSVGLFSPRRARYTLAVDDPDATIGPHLSQGRPVDESSAPLTWTGPLTVADLPLDMWSMRVLTGSSTIDCGGGVQLAGSVTSGAVDGQVTNGTRFVLRDCSVAYGGGTATVGDLRPGESKPVRVSNQALSQGPLPLVATGGRGVETLSRVRKAILAQLAPAARAYAYSPVQTQASGDPLLVGWVEGGTPLRMTVDGRPTQTRAEALLIAHLAAPPPIAAP